MNNRGCNRCFPGLMLGVLIGGCGSDQAGTSLPVGDGAVKVSPSLEIEGYEISDEQMSAYLAFKRIPDRPGDRRERARRTLEEQTAVANVIAGTPMSQGLEVAMELLATRNRILIDRYFEQYLEEVVTGEAIAAYYDEHGGRFGHLRARIAHIRLRTSGLQGSDDERVYEKALRLVEELNQGADFAQYVGQYSDDAATKDKGGDLGWIESGTGDPAILNAVAPLSEGEIAGPVRTPRGYHVIKVLEGPLIEPKPLSELEDQIRYRLHQERRAEEWRRLLEAAGLAGG